MGKPLKVLVVEDSDDDTLLAIRTLKKGGYDPEYIRVETAQAMSDSLREKPWDIILCDYKLPTFSGINAIALLAQTNIDIPLIIVSGAIGEETAVECMRLGAHDYVMKGNLSRLVPAIERELDEAKSRAERRRAEEALRESEEKYRNIFENAVEGIFQSTPDGRHISINPAFARICGFSSPWEMINTITDIQKQLYVHPEDRAKLMELLNGRDFVNDYETEFRRKDGEIIWVSMNARTVRNESGNIMLLEGTITDITERKKARFELQKKNLELARAYEELRNKQAMIIQQEKMASIGMLAAGIAHEIKNPLAIILQGIDYLKTAVTDNTLLLEVIERLNKAVRRADIIVKGLLSYSRQNSLSISEQDIPSLINDSLVLIDHELRKKNLQVIKQYAPDLPQVSVDGNQIKQVFVNVLLNGIDAMSPKGIFTISARQVEDDAGKNALQISFKDTGHGISSDKIKNIFDPFYTTKNIGNTGLGLSISKGIIDSHGGIIYGESHKGQGTNFIIELPVPREE